MRKHSPRASFSAQHLARIQYILAIVIVIINPKNCLLKCLPLMSVSCTFPANNEVRFFFSFIFISWRLITLQYCSGFAIHWHDSAMDLHVFPIPIPPPASLSIPSLWVFPVHQPWALVSCIQPGLVICFTLDSILVSILFSQNIPPSPSPTESQSLFCTSVSLWGEVLFRYSLARFLLQGDLLSTGKYF